MYNNKKTPIHQELGHMITRLWHVIFIISSILVAYQLVSSTDYMLIVTGIIVGLQGVILLTTKFIKE